MVFFVSHPSHTHCMRACGTSQIKQQYDQPFAFFPRARHSANSHCFNSLSKGLFVLPSRYLFATGLKLILFYMKLTTRIALHSQKAGL